jgi:hypothetical protein
MTMPVPNVHPAHHGRRYMVIAVGGHLARNGDRGTAFALVMAGIENFARVPYRRVLLCDCFPPYRRALVG